MTGKSNPPPRHGATPNDIRDVDARTQFVTALKEGMKNARMCSAGKPSAEKLGKSLGKDTRTGRRILAGEQKLDWELLRKRDPKLWAHFLRCLVMHERRARVI